MALPVALAACQTLGPDYSPPSYDRVARPGSQFVRSIDASLTTAAPLLAQWWLELDDPALNRLVDQALQANQNLASAGAAVRRLRGSLAETHSAAGPSIGAQASDGIVRLPRVLSNESAGTQHQLQLAFNASWEIDLFGGQRRAEEAAQAAAEAAVAQLDDARLSLTAEIARAYVELRGLQQRRALQTRSLQLLERSVGLEEARLAAGTATQVDVIRLRRQLADEQAELPDLDAQADARLNVLATLLGLAPGALDAELSLDRALPLPPARLAVGDAAAAIRRRPDVRAAERTLAMRSAQVGQAEAARMPSVSLFGLIGIGGRSLADLARLDDPLVVAAPRLSWSVADGGRGKARVVQAQASLEQAQADFQQRTLTALRDAEDALSRYVHQRISVAAVARSADEAKRASALAERRRQGGTGSRLAALTAEHDEIRAAQRLATSTTAMTVAYVSLQTALGLGWQEDAGLIDESSQHASANVNR